MVQDKFDSPTSKNEFRTALAHLVTMGAAHGVPVEETWLIMSATPEDTVDWTVTIGKPSDSSRDGTE